MNPPSRSFLLAIILASSQASGAEGHSVPGAASTRFEVRIDGRPLPVLDYKDVHYAHFSQVDPARVEVIAKDGPVTRARVQPGAYGLAVGIEGNRVSFTMPRPMSLVVQLDFREKLFLFGDPPVEAIPPGAMDAASLGAVGDGTTDNTAILQRAIDSLPDGGTLVLPSGHFRSGSLRLRSGMRLHLDSGALLQAVDDHTAIQPIPGATAYIGFLTGSNLERVAITGAGTIDGNGFIVRKACEAARKIAKQPGRILYLRDCREVSIRGVTLRDSYSWNLQLLRCEDASIEWLKILSDVRLSNHDGIDLVGCSGVEVSDSFVFSEDDGLSPKAAEDREVSENHTYRNLVIWAHKANGIRVGSESACRTMRNFRFEDIHILNGANGISLDTTEGAVYENFVFRNIRIEDLLQHYDDRYERDRERRMIDGTSHALVLYVNRQGATGPLGAIRGMTFEGLHWIDPRVKVRFEVPDAVIKRIREEGGQPPISDIFFRACTAAGKPVMSAADLGIRANDGIVSRVRIEP